MDNFILIKNGQLVSKDHDSVRNDILIKNDKIIDISPSIVFKPNYKIIDAKDKIVSPGFISIHSHCDFYLPFKEHLKLFEPLLLQGVTTALGGNCGFSIFPIVEKNQDKFKEYSNFLLLEDIKLKWESFENYKEYIKNRILFNFASLTGAGTLRVVTAGFEKELTKIQMIKMRELLTETLEDGTFGLSSGLMYMPETFSTTRQLIELVQIIKKPDDYLYSIHLRGVNETLLESVKEVIEIGEKTGIKVNISHLGPEVAKFNYQVEKIINLLAQAREKGIEITYDMLSYPGGCTTIMAIFPPWSYEKGVNRFLDDIKDDSFYKRVIRTIEEYVPKWPTWESGGWTDNFARSYGWKKLIVMGSRNKELFGKSIDQIAQERNKDIYDTLREVLIEENADILLYFKGARGADTFNNDEDLKYFDMLIENKTALVCVDEVFSKKGGLTYTPYMYGAFPRIINRYVKKKKKLTLKEAIERFTHNAIEITGIKNRGYLRKNHYADIVVFDYDRFTDYPAILEEQKKTEGVEYLLINGRLVIDKGKIMKNLSGRIIKKNDI